MNEHTDKKILPQRTQRKAFSVCVFVGQDKALPLLALLAMLDERQQRCRLC